MSVLSLACGLLGCQKEPEPAKHELSQITSVSISCGNMDRRYSYSFWAHKEENGWFLDAECFTYNYETETLFNSCELDSEDEKTLLEILEENESIAYVENYTKPKKSAAHFVDETTYGFCLNFSDGSQYVTFDRQKDLEKFFYRLAEKHIV